MRWGLKQDLTAGALVVAATFAQVFLMGSWLPGAFILLACLVSIGLFAPPEIFTCKYPVPRSSRLWLIAFVLFGTAFAVRSYQLDMFHNIEGLDARFGFVLTNLLKGKIIFPFIKDYEFDESLSAFFFFPFIRIFGYSWLSIKWISVGLSVLSIPIVFLYAARVFGLPAGVASAGLLIISTYFQRCDALISMVRFSLVGSLLVMALWLTSGESFQKRPCFNITVCGFISLIGVYLHSTGRIIPMLCMLNLGDALFRTDLIRRKTAVKAMSLFLLMVILIFLQLWIHIDQDHGYLYFKKRQIIGMHEDYPFSWGLMWETIHQTLTNYHYRAVLQTFFPDNKPLLNIELGISSLAGLAIILRNIRRRPFTPLFISLIVTTAPLMIVTPGAWRGLYFGPSILMMAVAGGLSLAWAAAWCSRSNPRLTIALIVAAIVLIGTHRIEYFFSGQFLSPRCTSIYSRLFNDMLREENTPHFFDADIGQMNPRNSLYEFTCASFFNRPYVIRFDPVRIYDDLFNEQALIIPDWVCSKAVFIVSPGNEVRLYQLRECFPDSRIDFLPETGYRILRLNNCSTTHGITDFSFVESEMVCQFMD